MKTCFVHLILLIIFLFTGSVFPQQSYDMKYGLKFGMNFATFAGKDGDNFRSATGMNIGGMIRKHISDNMFYQAEIIISEKGALDNQDIDSINVEIVWSMNYFEVPLLIGFDFMSANKSSLHTILYGGGFIAYNTSAKLRGDYDDVSTEFDYPDTKSLDFGFILGGSLEFNIQDSRLVLDARFTKSLTTFDESPQSWDFKNQVITAGIGYFF